jgi:Mycobacterial 4 TMS phage holin, superfamily IV
MVRFLIRILINLCTSALGLLLAGWIIPGVTITVSGFIVAVVVFTAAQAILAPFIFSVARRYAAPILGGIGLVSTLVALFIATLFPGGITINGVLAWILAPLVVWIVTALGGWILAAIFLKNRVQNSRANQGRA